jgi:preprotein translocase subunit SecB
MSAKKNTTEEQDSEINPIAINAQYIKDLSFENPTPINNFVPNDQVVPDFAINVETNAQKLSDDTYEVVLKTRAHATRGDNTMFLIELEYACIVTLTHVPEDLVRPILMVECPRLLFPYARQILSSITMESGFPPLYLNPIDFGDMYRRQMEAEGQVDNMPISATKN